ncbi:hypothetical protein Q5P01_000839 [Channa striata]|uniref:Uncharacterized protein n=1 Tax=Channa striata TaxID=64152 RepID=A0AA88IGC2_CHASR|nr:hypothetical protein Q5P01_000839 [Channa striata]
MDRAHAVPGEWQGVGVSDSVALGALALLLRDPSRATGAVELSTGSVRPGCSEKRAPGCWVSRALAGPGDGLGPRTQSRAGEQYALARGARIERCEAMAGSPNQPLTLSEALEVSANLSREFVTRSAKSRWQRWTRCKTFRAHVHETRRALVLPLHPATTKAWRWGGARPPEEKRRISGSVRAKGRGGERIPATACSLRPADRGRDGGPAAREVPRAAGVAQERGEIAKQSAGKKYPISWLPTVTLEELEAPSTLARRGPRWLYRMRFAQQERERARTLASPYPSEGRRRRARLAAEGFGWP